MSISRGRGNFLTEKSTGLIITSLIDFFSIVVIYLMKSYSAEGSLLTNADNLTLPNSNATIKPKDVTVQIAATSDMLLLDNNPIVPTDDIRRIPQTDPDPVITKLQEKLQASRAQEEEMVRLGASNKVEGNVTIQIDKNIEFDVLFKIMNTCGKVGYNNMNFAVMSRKED
jgi:biopolymer transport protein ExbD